MVVFDAGFRHYFPTVLGAVDDATIEGQLRKVHDYYEAHETSAPDKALGLAWAVCGKTLQYAPGAEAPEPADPLWLEPPGTEDNFSKFTRWGLHNGLWEATNTMLYFPLNILTAADVKRKEQGITHPVADSLSDIAIVMRQSWFHEVCEQASNTANSVWKWFTNDRIFQGEYHEATEFLGAQDVLEFDFFDTTTGLGFSFSGTSVQALKERKRTHNQEAAKLPQKERRDSVLKGMSGGCLGRYVQPIFDTSPADVASLGGLAAHYNTPTEALLAPRSESVIAFGLNRMAELLERADVINRRVAP
jgi:hypothetical protein